MRLVDQLLMCRGFAICKGFISPGETWNFTTDDTSSDGVFSQLGYLVQGSGTLYDADGNDRGRFENPGSLYDMRDYYGKACSIKVDSEGGSWICINPTPASKAYNGEVLKAETNKTIIGNDKEQVVVCLKGKISINDKVLDEFQYARIIKGKSANVVISSDSAGLYFYT